MIQIGGQLVSLDVLEKEFCCDLSKCKGICCVEGDAGAPITDSEIKDYQDNLDAIFSYLSPKNQSVLKEKGVFYFDEEGEKVTMLVDGGECAFTEHRDGMLFCAIEHAFRDGKIAVQKPISCHLYQMPRGYAPSVRADGKDLHGAGHGRAGPEDRPCQCRRGGT